MKKKLTPLLKQHLQGYIQRDYPLYEEFMEEFIHFLEKENSSGWYSTAGEKEDNSIYYAISNFVKHGSMADFPIENTDLMDAFIADNASNLDFRNLYIDFEDTVMRSIIQYSERIYTLKDSWRAYNYLFAIIHNYLLNGEDESLTFTGLFTTDTDFISDLSNIPNFYFECSVASISSLEYGLFIRGVTSGAFGIIKYIETNAGVYKIYVDDVRGTFVTGETIEKSDGTSLTTISNPNNNFLTQDEILLTEIPTFSSNKTDNGMNIESEEVTSDDRGAHPFEYQIISKNPVITAGDFPLHLRKTLNPAGFRADVIFLPKDSVTDIYHDTRLFPYTKYTLEGEEERILITGLYNTNTGTYLARGDSVADGDYISVESLLSFTDDSRQFTFVDSAGNLWWVFGSGFTIDTSIHPLGICYFGANLHADSYSAPYRSLSFPITIV